MKNLFNIRMATQNDKEKWDSYVLKHTHGIPYQLFAWKKAIENAYGFKGNYFIAETNNNIKGVLPLIHVHLPFSTGKLVSLPYCDAGGPLADSPEIEKLLILNALKFSNDLNISMVSIRSTREFAQIPSDLTLNQKKVRMVLQLPGNSSLLLSSLKAKVRSQVKKPLRDGLTAQIGGKELLEEFYLLFCENMRDLGSPVHSLKWIRNIFKAYKNRALVHLVRMSNNTPAAGGIILCNSSGVSVPWASSLRRYNRWNPNMLLYWSFLKFAADNGYETFDFGRSTPGEGTFRFKKQWGAMPVYLHWADFKSNIFNELIPETQQLSSNSINARQFVESAIMKLPVPASKTLGFLTRKYITL